MRQKCRIVVRDVQLTDLHYITAEASDGENCELYEKSSFFLQIHFTRRFQIIRFNRVLTF